jgi:hypothetical protein
MISALQRGRWMGRLGSPMAIRTACWVAYQSAVRAAITYGRLLPAAFDLYRFDMLGALHLPLPETKGRGRSLTSSFPRELAGEQFADNPAGVQLPTRLATPFAPPRTRPVSGTGWTPSR